MREIRSLTSLLFMIAALFLLSACGTSLEKPTGLEELDNELIEAEQTTEEVASHLEAPNHKHVSADKQTDQKTNSKEKSVEIVEEKDDKQVKEEPSPQTTEKESRPQTTEKKSSAADRSETSQSDASQQVDPSTKVEKEEKEEKEKKEKKNSTSTSTTPEKKEPSNDSSTPKDSPKEQDGKQETPAPEKPKVEEPNNTIAISIVISENEVPLPATELEIEDGDSALDALIEITMKKKVQMDYRGGRGASAYVEGIDNVYEFDRGPGSGWMYRVNGIFPNRGAGVVPLQGGDRVEWLYTENLGEDLGADLQPFR